MSIRCNIISKTSKKASALQDKLTDLLPKCNLSDEDFKTLKDNIKSFKST